METARHLFDGVVRFLRHGGLWWGVGISVGAAVLTLVARRRRGRRLAGRSLQGGRSHRRRSGALRPHARAGFVGKNLAGVVLVLLGAIMAVPGVPGQGLLTCSSVSRCSASRASGGSSGASFGCRRSSAPSTGCARGSRGRRWRSTDGGGRSLRAAGDRLCALEQSAPRRQLADHRLGLGAAVRDGAVRAADPGRGAPLHLRQQPRRRLRRVRRRRHPLRVRRLAGGRGGAERRCRAARPVSTR